MRPLLRLTAWPIGVVVAVIAASVAMVAVALPSTLFAQAGVGAAASGETATEVQVQTSTKATTRLYVKTLPPGAQVTLDGKPLGAGDGLFLVPAGTGKVSVQFDGAEPQVRHVEIAEGRITRVEIAAGAATATPAPTVGPSIIRSTPSMTPPQDIPPGTPAPPESVCSPPAIEPCQEPTTPPAHRMPGYRGTPPLPSGQPFTEVPLLNPALAPLLRLDLTGPSKAVVGETLRYTVTVENNGTADSRPSRLNVVWDGNLTPKEATPFDLDHLSDDMVSWDIPALLPGESRALQVNLQAKAGAGTGTVIANIVGDEPQVRQVEIEPGLTDNRVRVERRTVVGVDGRDLTMNMAPRLTSTAERVDPKPLTAIDGVLEKPLAHPFQFEETPLRAVLGQFSEAAGIDVLVDEAALSDVAFDLDATTVTCRMPAGLPLATALDVALREANLTWIVRDDLVEITTPERASERLLVRIHDVSDIAADAAGRTLLIEMVRRLIHGSSWNPEGGGSIMSDSPAGTALVVSQSWREQRQVAAFLDLFRRLKAMPAEARRPLSVEGYWSDQLTAVATRAALDKPVRVSFDESPLRAVIQGLADQAGVPITADMRALGDAGMDIDATCVTFRLADRPLAVVLDHILEPMSLVYEVTNAGLVVTTENQSESMMTTAMYPVGHLGGGDRQVGGLAKLIESLVTPDLWENCGGGAVVLPADGDVPCLAVLHSTAGHRAVDEVLRSFPPSQQPGAFAPTPATDATSSVKKGGLKGQPFCWVAREVYGPHDPRWLVFRDWLTADGPAWLRALYGIHGESFAAWIRDKPAAKRALRVFMDRVVAAGTVRSRT